LDPYLEGNENLASMYPVGAFANIRDLLMNSLCIRQWETSQTVQSDEESCIQNK